MSIDLDELIVVFNDIELRDSKIKLKSTISTLSRYRILLAEVRLRKHWKMSDVINLLALNPEDQVEINDRDVPIIEIHSLLIKLELPNRIETAWKSLLQFLLTSISEARSDSEVNRIYTDYNHIKECLMYYLNDSEIFDLKTKITKLVIELMENFITILKEVDNVDDFKQKIRILNLVKMIIIELGTQRALVPGVCKLMSREIQRFSGYLISLGDEAQDVHGIQLHYFKMYLEIMREVAKESFYPGRICKSDPSIIEIQQSLLLMNNCKNVDFHSKFLINGILRSLM